jgi:glycosyltransferase involved in cell wall biosynthesis
MMESVGSPLFSVVVPVFNKAKYLDDALGSLFSQTFRDFEIVAVDDGSTDGSLERLVQYQAQGKLRLYQRHQPGPGGYAARNHGARLARGQWLLFQDADDWCSPDHLAQFNESIQRTQGRAIKLYVNAYAKLRGDRAEPAVAYPHEGEISRQQGLELFSRSDYIHMNGACIERAAFLESGGFPAGVYRRGGDVYYWIRMLATLEKSHYNRKITSQWKIDHCSISNDIRNLAHVHPARDALSSLSRKLSWREAYYARKAINRKLVSWSVEKRTHGMKVMEDIGSLYLSALSIKQLLHCMMLLLPRNLFQNFRSLVAKHQ